MAQDAIRVLIADDHTVVRKGLKALLSAKKYGVEVIGEASNGDEAVKLARELVPDVILMDLVMPEKSGLQAIVEIKQETRTKYVYRFDLTERWVPEDYSSGGRSGGRPAAGAAHGD